MVEAKHVFVGLGLLTGLTLLMKRAMAEEIPPPPPLPEICGLSSVGATRVKECRDGRITQTCTILEDGTVAYFPPCPEDYELTIRVVGG